MKELPPGAWIFTNHSPDEIYSGYASIRPQDHVVAADAGLRTIQRLGLLPDMLIGDLDSLDAGILASYPDLPRSVSDPHKDETDTELALLWCLEQGYRHIVICNDLSGRFDHALGILQVMYAAHLSGALCRVESATQQLFFLPEMWEAKEHPSHTLSLVAWTDEALVESFGGLEYPLDKLLLRREKARGISNRIISGDARVHLLRGQVLAILTKN